MHKHMRVCLASAVILLELVAAVFSLPVGVSGATSHVLVTVESVNVYGYLMKGVLIIRDATTGVETSVNSDGKATVLLQTGIYHFTFFGKDTYGNYKYLLQARDVRISDSTNSVTLDARKMNCGRISVGHSSFDVAVAYIFGAFGANNSSAPFATNSWITVSEGTYDVRVAGIRVIGEKGFWRYTYERPAVKVIGGSETDLGMVGGPLRMDLSGLSDRLETGAVLSLKGLLLSDDSGFVLQAIVDEHEDSVFPSVEVVDSQGTRIYSSTAAEHQIRFTRSGTYTLSVSVNTGPLQGVLSATKSIVVQDPVFHTITAVADEGSQILPSGSVSVKHGETKEFIIDASPGYVLKDVLVDGISIGVVRTYRFTNVTRDHTIQVVSEPVLDYVIKVVSSGGGSVYPGTTRVAHGGGVTFLITPFDGFRIKDVLVDGVSIGPVETYTFLPVLSDHTLEVIFEPSQTNIVLHIGDKTFYVDGYPLSLDSPPIIKNGRTLLPIRAIVEALGGQVGWDANQKKVTVTLGSNRVELWIGKNTALVNGRQVMIDAANPKVVPEIINGRTMLPLRFVAESLGCSVEWDGNTQTVRVTYQKP